MKGIDIIVIGANPSFVESLTHSFNVTYGSFKDCPSPQEELSKFKYYIEKEQKLRPEQEHGYYRKFEKKNKKIK